MAGLDFPLSALHPSPRGDRRMTRGRTGSLFLVRAALSSATHLRLSPALSLTPLLPRSAVRRSSPLGATKWQKRIAKRLGIEHTLRARGRPRNTAEATTP